MECGRLLEWFASHTRPGGASPCVVQPLRSEATLPHGGCADSSGRSHILENMRISPKGKTTCPHGVCADSPGHSHILENVRISAKGNTTWSSRPSCLGTQINWKFRSPFCERRAALFWTRSVHSLRPHAGAWGRELRGGIRSWPPIRCRRGPPRPPETSTPRRVPAPPLLVPTLQRGDGITTLRRQRRAGAGRPPPREECHPTRHNDKPCRPFHLHAVHTRRTRKVNSKDLTPCTTAGPSMSTPSTSSIPSTKHRTPNEEMAPGECRPP